MGSTTYNAKRVTDIDCSTEQFQEGIQACHNLHQKTVLQQEDVPNTLTAEPSKADREFAKKTIYEQGKQIVADGHGLVELYKEVSESIGQHQFQSPEALWKKDKDTMKRLLAYGYEYGEALVDRQLEPHKWTDFVPETADDPELDEMMGRLFMKSRQVVQDDSWGSAMSRQLEGFEALTRCATGKDAAI
jgi:hypothetical protein